MNNDWSNINKQFQLEISKEKTFEDGIKTLLTLREELFNELLNIKNTIPLNYYSMQPLIKSKGYDSKTIIYSIYHISRIEDIVLNTIIKNEEQVFFKDNFNISTNSPIITTGNELKGEEIKEFSEKLDIEEIYKYFIKVHQTSNEYISSLEYKDLKIKVNNEIKKKLIDSKCVSEDENAFFLVDYWCNKDILGLLKMPFSRHLIMHIDASKRIIDAIKKKNN